MTQVYLYNETIHNEILRHLSKIENFLQCVEVHNILRHHDLVLDLSLVASKHSSYVCGYYFINCQECLIFWLQNYLALTLDCWRPEDGHRLLCLSK